MSTRAKALTTVVTVLAIVLAVLWMRRGQGPSGKLMDLVDTFPEAEKRTDIGSLEKGFSVLDVAINGETKRSIFAHPHARIIWSIIVPPGAVLKTSLGMEPETWDKPDADGAQFRVGVSDGKSYEELLRQYINPHGRPNDRRWVPASVDLSAYAGRKVNLIFNTDPGPPGVFQNPAWDWAVWGEPAIYGAGGK